jgi:hypothetical protein
MVTMGYLSALLANNIEHGLYIVKSQEIIEGFERSFKDVFGRELIKSEV